LVPEASRFRTNKNLESAGCYGHRRDVSSGFGCRYGWIRACANKLLSVPFSQHFGLAAWQAKGTHFPRPIVAITHAWKKNRIGYARDERAGTLPSWSKQARTGPRQE